MKDKLQKAIKIAGGLISKNALEKAEKELKTDFVPEMYDKAMEKVFDEKFYEQEEKSK